MRKTSHETNRTKNGIKNSTDSDFPFVGRRASEYCVCVCVCIPCECVLVHCLLVQFDGQKGEQ